MRYFALSSLIPLAFGIFSSAAPTPGGIDDSSSDLGSGGGCPINIGAAVAANLSIRRRQLPNPPSVVDLVDSELSGVSGFVDGELSGTGALMDEVEGGLLSGTPAEIIAALNQRLGPPPPS